MYKVLLVTFKVVHAISVPEYLVSLLEPYTPPRRLRPGDKGLLNVPKVSRKVGERAFQVVTSRYWNSLDSSYFQEELENCPVSASTQRLACA